MTVWLQNSLQYTPTPQHWSVTNTWFVFGSPQSLETKGHDWLLLIPSALSVHCVLLISTTSGPMVKRTWFLFGKLSFQGKAWKFHWTRKDKYNQAILNSCRQRKGIMVHAGERTLSTISVCLLINSRSREKHFQTIYNVLGYVLVIFMPRSNDEKAMAANMAEQVPGR